MSTGTLREVTPNLAELLNILPNCTNSDIDEILRFLKILHRGREYPDERDRTPRRIPYDNNKNTIMRGGMANAYAQQMGLGMNTMQQQQMAMQQQQMAIQQQQMAMQQGNGGGMVGMNQFNNNSGGMGGMSMGMANWAGGGQAVGSQNYPKRQYTHKPAVDPHPEYNYHGKEIEKKVIEQIESNLGSATTAEEAKAALAICQEDKELYHGTFAIFGKYCRNCYLGGVGFENVPQHSVAECKQLGNRCFVECRNCANGECHWIDDCPKRFAHNQPNQQVQWQAQQAAQQAANNQANNQDGGGMMNPFQSVNEMAQQ